jgi:hypothetical protein
VRDIVDAKVEQQRQAKLRKGSAGGTTTPYRRIPVSPNKSRFRQLSSFIPARPTSSNFPRWAVKTQYDLNAILSNANDSDSEYEVTSQNTPKPVSKVNVNFKNVRFAGKFIKFSCLIKICRLYIYIYNVCLFFIENFERDLAKSLNNFNGQNGQDESPDNNNQVKFVTKSIILIILLIILMIFCLYIDDNGC